MPPRAHADRIDCLQDVVGSRKTGRQGGRQPSLCENVRRELIIDAASRVLQDHGYQDASMDRIASASGMSKKTLYQMFDSKHALFGAVMAERLLTSNLDTLMLEGETTCEKLTFGMTRLANEFLRPARLGVLRALITEVHEMPEVATHMRCYFEGSSRRFPIHVWLLTLGFDAGLCGCSLETASEHLFGMTVGLLTLGHLMQFRAARPDTERNAFIAHGVSLFLRAIPLASPTKG